MTDLAAILTLATHKSAHHLRRILGPTILHTHLLQSRVSALIRRVSRSACAWISPFFRPPPTYCGAFPNPPYADVARFLQLPAVDTTIAADDSAPYVTVAGAALTHQTLWSSPASSSSESTTGPTLSLMAASKLARADIRLFRGTCQA